MHIRGLFSSVTFNMASGCIHIGSDSELKTRQSRLKTWWAVLAQACMSRPITADWVFWRRDLKETGAKKSISDRGWIQSCSTEQYKKTVFWELKHISIYTVLVVTQNKIINPENEDNMYPSPNIIILLPWRCGKMWFCLSIMSQVFSSSSYLI